MPDWRAVQCQSQREALALNGLEALGLRCWFPYRLVRRWLWERRVRIKVGYFPGYVFADVEGVETASVNSVNGVDRVLGEAPIPEIVMVELMARAEADGFVPDPPARPGDHVQLRFHRLVAELVALDDRQAKVLIPLFGRMTYARVPASLVQS